MKGSGARGAAPSSLACRGVCVCYLALYMLYIMYNKHLLAHGAPTSRGVSYTAYAVSPTRRSVSVLRPAMAATPQHATTYRRA